MNKVAICGQTYTCGRIDISIKTIETHRESLFHNFWRMNSRLRADEVADCRTSTHSNIADAKSWIAKTYGPGWAERLSGELNAIKA